jgi:hypothetical protein
MKVDECTFMGEMRNAHKTLVEHLMESHYLGDLGAGYINEITCEVVDWIHLHLVLM